MSSESVDGRQFVGHMALGPSKFVKGDRREGITGLDEVELLPHCWPMPPGATGRDTAG
jgi:hypothetical protein